MQRIPFGSPTKENLQASPNKKRKGELLPELLALLKAAGVTLPAHISQQLANP
jgi:hypothetical protein